ncbi:YolD-like family protein [Paenibacillus sp.]|uniref:YolD-like family protein n=1 Tax=Paenibacillus sp. TaxID=58172 RepID=UPI0028219C19|nr:YolD-like family protein [Paenibacillus sp.]MDR0269187.1 YolD-like family protein [Paenibacillus sp.]
MIAPNRDSDEITVTWQKGTSEWQRVEQELTRSLEEHVKIHLTVDTPHGTSHLRGFVTVINTYLKEIKLREEDDWQWIRFEDIRSVQI